MKLSREFKNNVDLHIKNISLKLMKMSLQTKNNPIYHLLFQALIQAQNGGGGGICIYC